MEKLYLLQRANINKEPTARETPLQPQSATKAVTFVRLGASTRELKSQQRN